MVLVPEGKVCSTILQLYNEEAIVAEPAGALTIAALDFYKEKIKGKNVVCIVSGGNNDITRTEEIKERNCDLRIRNSKMQDETQLWIRRLRDEAFVDKRI